MIVAVDYGYGYVHVCGLFESVEQAQEIINGMYPEIKWEEPDDDEKGTHAPTPTIVMAGGKPTPNAHGGGTHLDEPFVMLCEVQVGELYKFEWL